VLQDVGKSARADTSLEKIGGTNTECPQIMQHRKKRGISEMKKVGGGNFIRENTRRSKIPHQGRPAYHLGKKEPLEKLNEKRTLGSFKRKEKLAL